MIIGMFAGCIAAAFWEIMKFRMPVNKIRVYQALIGGIIAGFGARLGMGCNLASFLQGFLNLVFMHGFTAFMMVGVYFGVKVALSPFFQSKIKCKSFLFKKFTT